MTNFLDKFKWFSKKNMGEATSPDVSSEETRTSDANTSDGTNAIKNDLNTNVFSFRERGFMNGALGVDPEPFSNYAVSYNTLDYLSVKIERLKNKVVRLKQTLNIAVSRYETYLKDLSPLEIKVKKYQDAIDAYNQRIDRKKELILLRKGYVESYKTDSSWLYLIFMLLAAVAFILADFQVSYSVVSDALSVGESPASGSSDDTDEGQTDTFSNFLKYSLAAGICAFSILLKPAYDRLVEKEYDKGVNVQRFTWVILIVAVCVLVFLVVAGSFRFEAFGAKTDGSGVAGLKQMYKDNPDLIRWFFILSGILFAIGGAICLGIVLPLLRTKSISSWYSFENRVSAAYIWVHTRRIQSTRKKIAVPLVKKDILHRSYELIEPPIDVRKQLYLAEAELEEAIKDRFLLLIRAHKDEYEDGYKRGLRIAEINGDEWVYNKVAQLYNNGDSYDGEENSSGEKAEQLSTEQSDANKYSRTRPFVALRKIIINNYRNSLRTDKSPVVQPMDFKID